MKTPCLLLLLTDDGARVHGCAPPPAGSEDSEVGDTTDIRLMVFKDTVNCLDLLPFSQTVPLEAAESAVISSHLQCSRGCTVNCHWSLITVTLEETEISQILNGVLQPLFPLVSKWVSGAFILEGHQR